LHERWTIVTTGKSSACVAVSPVYEVGDWSVT
jgi:hypothetical protein